MDRFDLITLITNSRLSVDQCFVLEKQGVLRIVGGSSFDYEWSIYHLELLSQINLINILNFIRNERN